MSFSFDSLIERLDCALQLAKNDSQRQQVAFSNLFSINATSPLISEDVLYDIFPFLSHSKLYELSLLCQQWCRIAHPLAERICPHFIGEMEIEEQLQQKSFGPFYVKVRVARDAIHRFWTGHLWSSEHRFDRVPLPCTAPPPNILGIRILRFTAHIGPQSLNFLRLCRRFFVSQQTKLCIGPHFGEWSAEVRELVAKEVTDYALGMIELSGATNEETRKWIEWAMEERSGDSVRRLVVHTKRLWTPEEVLELAEKLKKDFLLSPSVRPFVLLIRVKHFQNCVEYPLVAEKNESAGEMLCGWLCDAPDLKLRRKYYKIFRLRKEQIRQEKGQKECKNEIYIG